MQQPQPGLKPGPLNLEYSMLTIRPPNLPNDTGVGRDYTALFFYVCLQIVSLLKISITSQLTGGRPVKGWGNKQHKLRHWQFHYDVKTESKNCLVIHYNPKSPFQTQLCSVLYLFPSCNKEPLWCCFLWNSLRRAHENKVMVKLYAYCLQKINNVSPTSIIPTVCSYMTSQFDTSIN